MRLKLLVLALGIVTSGVSFARNVTVSIRANRGQLLSAVGGGGGDLLANRYAVGQWEEFTIIDRNGGALMSKDKVCLETFRRYFVVAESGGGREARANRGNCGPWETFTIVKIASNGWPVEGEIEIPGRVAFRSANGSYMVAESGGGGAINVNRPAIGPWETFRLK
jgi:hypothetical protein